MEAPGQLQRQNSFQFREEAGGQQVGKLPSAPIVTRLPCNQKNPDLCVHLQILLGQEASSGSADYSSLL
jgi:hypothetical protein